MDTCTCGSPATDHGYCGECLRRLECDQAEWFHRQALAAFEADWRAHRRPWGLQARPGEEARMNDELCVCGHPKSSHLWSDSYGTDEGTGLLAIMGSVLGGCGHYCDCSLYCPVGRIDADPPEIITGESRP